MPNSLKQKSLLMCHLSLTCSAFTHSHVLNSFSLDFYFICCMGKQGSGCLFSKQIRTASNLVSVHGGISIIDSGWLNFSRQALFKLLPNRMTGFTRKLFTLIMELSLLTRS